jgi:sulfur carrier protein
MPADSGEFEPQAMTILFNGQECGVAASLTVSGLLRQFQLEPRLVAVEVNLQLIPRTRHAEWMLHDGDCVEVVTLTGGG